ncbi:hypothetical protein BKA83DRAFT_4127804 [Pisolithus microcarpus]|nr:hypothetical protein BKA83DRAFT_4127804 [Pisolithus microcarpus]
MHGGRCRVGAVTGQVYQEVGLGSLGWPGGMEEGQNEARVTYKAKHHADEIPILTSITMKGRLSTSCYLFFDHGAHDQGFRASPVPGHPKSMLPKNAHLECSESGSVDNLNKGAAETVCHGKIDQGILFTEAGSDGEDDKVLRHQQNRLFRTATTVNYSMITASQYDSLTVAQSPSITQFHTVPHSLPDSQWHIATELQR